MQPWAAALDTNALRLQVKQDMSESLPSDPEGHRAARNSLIWKREHDFTLPGASEVQLKAGLWLQGTGCKSIILSTHSFQWMLDLFPFFSSLSNPFPASLFPVSLWNSDSLHFFRLLYPLTKQNTSFPIPTPSQANFLNTEQPAIFTLLGPVSSTSPSHRNQLISLPMMSPLLWDDISIPKQRDTGTQKNQTAVLALHSLQLARMGINLGHAVLCFKNIFVHVILTLVNINHHLLLMSMFMPDAALSLADQPVWNTMLQIMWCYRSWGHFCCATLHYLTIARSLICSVKWQQYLRGLQ